MTRFLLSLVLSSAASCDASAGAEPVRRTGSRTSSHDPIFICDRMLGDCPDPTSRARVLDGIVGYAREGLASGDPDAASLMKYAASMLFREHQPDRAIALLHEVLTSSASPGETADTWRLIGQYELARPGGVIASSIAYANQLQLMEQRAMTRGVNADMYRMGVMGHAKALEAQGLTLDAIHTRQRLLSIPRQDLLPGTHESIVLEVARGYRECGDLASASAWYDRLFTEFPEYGRDDGRIVWLLLERARSVGWDDANVEAHLRQLWTDPSLAEFPQSLDIGSELAHVILSRGESGASAVEAHLAVFRRYIDRRHRWGPISDELLAVARENLYTAYGLAKATGVLQLRQSSGALFVSEFSDDPRARRIALELASLP